MRPRSDSAETDTARLLGRLLRCDAEACREADGWPREALLAAADHHGVVSLLADLARSGCGSLPRHRAELDRVATDRAALDLVQERATRGLLEHLFTANVRVLVVKGVDLAYSLYLRPDLRPRLDVDLWIARADRVAASRVLRERGYASTTAVGDRVMSQETFVSVAPGAPHVVDLHWRIANAERFARTLTFDDAWADAEPRPRLSVEARGLSRPHALALACLHRAAHHYGSQRLIWLYDIDLLAKSLSPDDWSRWVAFVRERRVARVSADGLARAADLLGTHVPPVVLETLRASDEPDVAGYLDPGARHATRILADLRHAPSWRSRMSLLGEHAFPSPAFMREVYAPGSRWPVPLLYLLRIGRGAGRWLRRR